QARQRHPQGAAAGSRHHAHGSRRRRQHRPVHALRRVRRVRHGAGNERGSPQAYCRHRRRHALRRGARPSRAAPRSGRGPGFCRTDQAGPVPGRRTGHHAAPLLRRPYRQASGGRARAGRTQGASPHHGHDCIFHAGSPRHSGGAGRGEPEGRPENGGPGTGRQGGRRKMKPVIVVSLCIAIGGCAEYGMDFDVVSAVAPRTAEVKSLDEASTSRLYLSVVNGLLEQGRYRAALAYLDQYAVQEKKTSYFMELYGEALLGTERYDDAAEAFASLEGTEREPQGFSGLGRVNAAKGDWPSAVTHFKQAVAARPSSAEFLNNLGYAQLCAGGGAIADAEFNLRQA